MRIKLQATVLALASLAACSRPETTSSMANIGQPQRYELHGVEMKITVPQNYKQGTPVPLAIYLHGDSAKDYYNDWYNPSRDFAVRQGAIFVAALSPNKNSWWHQDSYADTLGQVMDSLKQTYTIDQNKILFAGVSGGSTFLTMQFIPRQGHRHPGVIAANCGGAEPRAFVYQPNQEVMSKIAIHYVYGSRDFLADPKGYWGDRIHGSINAYRQRKFNVQEEVLPGLEHCRFNTNHYTVRAWSQRLKEASTPTTQQPLPTASPGPQTPISSPVPTVPGQLASLRGGTYTPLDGTRVCQQTITSEQIASSAGSEIKLGFYNCADASALTIRLKCAGNTCTGQSSSGVQHEIVIEGESLYSWRTSSGLQARFNMPAGS